MCSIQHEKIEDQEKKIQELEEKLRTIQVSICIKIAVLCCIVYKAKKDVEVVKYAYT